jgi:peptide/nickel transport system substrate-binding protein
MKSTEKEGSPRIVSVNRKLRIRTAAALGIAALLTAAGCSSAAKDATSPASSSTGTPQYGGTLTVGILAPCGLDKQQTSGCNFIINQVVDNLTDQLPSNGKIVPWLATSWTISPNGEDYTFHLRPGVTFSDGEPLNAEAVKINFDDIITLGKEGKSFQAAAYLQGYTGTKVINNLTFEVGFDKPNAGFLEALSEKPLGLIAPKDIEDTTPDERLTYGVIGSGPFVISKVVPNQEIILTRRSGYTWNSPKDQHTGEAYLKEIIFRILPEDDVRTGALTSGAIQVESGIPSQDIAPLQREGYTTVARASAGIVLGYYPNVYSPILSDVKVRQAIQVALDRQAIHTTVYNQFETVPTSVLSTTHPNYVDLSSDLAYNPTEAGQLLTSDGWKVGAGGFRYKDGKELTLTIDDTDPGSGGDPNEIVQEELAQVGINLQIHDTTEAQATADEADGNWDLQDGNLTRPDGDVLVSDFDYLYSDEFKKPYNSQLQSLLQEQSSQLNAVKRQQELAQIQEIILQQGYDFPISQESQELTAGPSVHGLSFEAPYWPDFFDTWISS